MPMQRVFPAISAFDREAEAGAADFDVVPVGGALVLRMLSMPVPLSVIMASGRPSPLRSLTSSMAPGVSLG